MVERVGTGTVAGERASLDGGRRTADLCAITGWPKRHPDRSALSSSGSWLKITTARTPPSEQMGIASRAELIRDGLPTRSPDQHN